MGRSFYGQILPSNSVNLAWSSWSVQWLGRVPMPIPDHVVASYCRDADVTAAYARQAAHDWHASSSRSAAGNFAQAGGWW